MDGENHTGKRPGDLVIFDGTRQHGAWNRSDQDRVVLHIDFVKPEAFTGR
ncbi:MAG: aspartyl/asparaginyl beta-hydroxylase domain-containing protein [Acidobacteriota bacterium]